jgi:uncharacterized protein YhaN
MKFITKHFTPTTPEALRLQHLDKLRLMQVRAELALDQTRADLDYINAAIARLEQQTRAEAPRLCKP